MKKLLSTSIIFSAFIGLVACATTTTTVLNNSDGSYTIEASDKNESAALDGGIKKADELCHAKNKSAIIQSHKSKYTGGMDPNAKGLLNTAASVTSLATGGYVAKQDTSKDYMVTIKFKCD